MGNEDRAAILRRRARLIAAMGTGAALSGGGCDIEPQVCLSIAALCDVQTRCNGDTLERCNNTTGDWKQVADCDPGACDADAGACVAADAGADASADASDSGDAD